MLSFTVLKSTHLDKIPNDRKSGGTRKHDSMRCSAEHTVKQLNKALNDFASILKSTQNSSSEDNESESIGNERLSKAIDEVWGIPSLGRSRVRFKGGAHVR